GLDALHGLGRIELEGRLSADRGQIARERGRGGRREAQLAPQKEGAGGDADDDDEGEQLLGCAAAALLSDESHRAQGCSAIEVGMSVVAVPSETRPRSVAVPAVAPIWRTWTLAVPSTSVAA